MEKRGLGKYVSERRPSQGSYVLGIVRGLGRKPDLMIQGRKEVLEIYRCDETSSLMREESVEKGNHVGQSTV